MQKPIFATPVSFSHGNGEESDDISDDATGSEDVWLLMMKFYSFVVIVLIDD